MSAMVLERNGVASVGERVTRARERRGWSKNELARRAEIGVSTVSRIESGIIASPGVDVLGKIARSLGVALSEITGETPMPRRRTEITEGVARVPLRTLRVQAGGRPTWDDTRDTIVVSARAALNHPNAFAAIVTGRCMVPYINPGDIVLIDPDRQPTNGEMVVITDDAGDTIVKWYRVDPLGRPFLRAADGTELRPNGARIEGVVFKVESDAVRDPEA